VTNIVLTLHLLNIDSEFQLKSGFCCERSVLNKKQSPALQKSFELAVGLIRVSKLLNENKSFDLSRQLVRSGTSIGANLREAQAPESRADFIHKLKISLKEGEETMFWLELVKETENIEVNQLIRINLELLKIINKSISTAKQNSQKPS
jgi:four helix bundle protein